MIHFLEEKKHFSLSQDNSHLAHLASDSQAYRHILSGITDLPYSSVSLFFCYTQNTLLYTAAAQTSHLNHGPSSLCPQDWEFSTCQELYKEGFHAKLSPCSVGDTWLLLPLDSTLDQFPWRKEMWLANKAHAVLLPEQPPPAMTQKHKVHGH